MAGAFEGNDKQDGHQVGQEIRDNEDGPARMIWRMVRESARNEDDFVRRPNEADQIDHQTTFIIKRHGIDFF